MKSNTEQLVHWIIPHI